MYFQHSNFRTRHQQNPILLVHFKSYPWWCHLLIYFIQHWGRQKGFHLRRVHVGGSVFFFITNTSGFTWHSWIGETWFLKPAANLDIYFVYFVGIANIAKRERNRGAKQLDALMKVCSFLHICQYILWNKLIVWSFYTENCSKLIS